ncbi:uncharacterized protein PV06_00252 [Exophiala oligosperma]|uniref:Ricin B lectin domain-containing protein n=1 Tax=Exophiala oligosperma TaxID=215243 RepID=A0A0D2EHZ6_9EURO|nr:uncharacterized protein PV06_00252 [Exophiala oligosperma]KIW47564.1 hypothetical protein PV06_00252 [Exophiala oligosperma]
MVALLCAALLGSASLIAGLPVAEKRTVTALDQGAFEEAQQRDDTATRAFSSVPIKTSTGQCLFVDELSGDFRANLTPIEVGTCDGSDGQLWDVITAGKHDDQPGTMLIVSTLTQACFNFDPRRAAGNQVILFSCGGRADGSGSVTDSQLFPFAGSAGPQSFSPVNSPGTCLTVSGAVLDQTACDATDANQSFTFGDVISASTAVASASLTSATTAVEVVSPTSTSGLEIETITSPPTTSPTAAASTTSASVVSVSRAGAVLNSSAVAEANPRDVTATRAFSSVAIKSADGQCLFIDPTAGDFRENLIPIVLQPCDGSANQQWDVITAGKHNDQPNSALIVSSLTQGCLNFDPRRAAEDTVITFSCGGRADGGGTVTNSQLFTFTSGQTSLTLQPENGSGDVCLVPNSSGRLDQATCSGTAHQLFTIE